MVANDIGRVLVVTGSTGIAAAAARAHGVAGGRVFVISIDGESCAALCAELGDGAWAQADLRDEAATVAAFTQCRERYGRIDGLFAVAGGSGRRYGDGSLHEVPASGWDATIADNLQPVFLATREAIRIMLHQDRDEQGSRGSIVVTSSVLAEHPSGRLFSTHAYATSKAAALGLVRATAARYAPDGIRINAVAPGLTLTPMAARAAADLDTKAYAAAKQPLVGGMVTADDVAAAALFLLSPGSRAVTGQVLAVDGGWSVSEGPG